MNQLIHKSIPSVSVYILCCQLSYQTTCQFYVPSIAKGIYSGNTFDKRIIVLTYFIVLLRVLTFIS